LTTDTAQLVGAENCSTNTQSTNPKPSNICHSVQHVTCKIYASCIPVIHTSLLLVIQHCLTPNTARCSEIYTVSQKTLTLNH